MLEPPQDKLGSGVYSFTNRVDGKVYVGSSRRINARRAQHVSDLNAGFHCNNYLQNAWRKHGESSFVFAVLELIDDGDPAKLLVAEQHWIDSLRSWDRGYGYNIRRFAQNVQQEVTEAYIPRARRAKVEPTHKPSPVKSKGRPPLFTYTDAAEVFGTDGRTISGLVKALEITPKLTGLPGKSRGLDRDDMKRLAKSLGKPFRLAVVA